MEITSKTKGVIIAILFILLLILPVSYGLIRAYFSKHSHSQPNIAPAEQPATK
jgi:flagellar basal body-associated protein FliL